MSDELIFIFNRFIHQGKKIHPKLNVGLHLVLTNGKAILDHSEIPKLINSIGEFRTSQFYSGIKYFFSIKTRKQLKKEIRAQFEAFSKTGLKLDHVNAHNHMHLHPTIFNLIIKIGYDYNLTAIRIRANNINWGYIHVFWIATFI